MTQMDAEDSVAVLKERLAAAKSVAGSTKKEYKRLITQLSRSKDPDSHSLKKSAVFELHSSDFKARIHSGIEILQELNTKQSKSLPSQLFEHKQNKKHSLEDILEGFVEKTAESEKKIRWTFRMTSDIARAVARLQNPRHVEYEGSQSAEKEQRLLRQERVPSLIHHIMDAAVPKLGVGAAFLFTALRGMH